MISESYCHILEKANRRLALSWERLKKARKNGNTEAIKAAEMAYLQALQCAYDAAVASVSAYSIPASTR